MAKGRMNFVSTTAES